MTSSKVTLRLQEFVPENEFAALAQGTNIPEETLRRYATDLIEVNEETAKSFQKIAKYLKKQSVLDLLKPVGNNEVVRLRISALTEGKGWTLQHLSEKTDINLILLEFYSKQPIYKQKLTEPKSQENLNKICNVLDCTIEELMLSVKAEQLPETKLRLEELAQEIGLSLYDLSLLTDLPYELIDLMATQPIDASSSIFVEQASIYFMKATFCDKFGHLFKHICKK